MHDREAVALCQLRGGIRDALRVREDRLKRPARDEHHRRVDDVLAGRAAVHVAGRLGRELAFEGCHERDRGVAAARGLPSDRGHVELIDPAGRGNRDGRLARDQADGRAGARQPGLEVEHRLRPGTPVDLRGRAAAREYAGEGIFRWGWR